MFVVNERIFKTVVLSLEIHMGLLMNTIRDSRLPKAERDSAEALVAQFTRATLELRKAYKEESAVRPDLPSYESFAGIEVVYLDERDW